MNPKDKQLWRRIDEVCHYRWDPIGVADTAYARSEYQSYVPEIFRHVKAGDFNTIVGYMNSVVTGQMGLSFDEDGAKQAALLMLEWKKVIDERS
jgi:hypothetical protein